MTESTASGNNISAVGPVLLVEDSLADAFIIEQLFALARLPAALQIVRDGEEALILLRQKGRRDALSAILLDLDLPKASGLEVLKLIRRERADLPVIVVTSREWPCDLGITDLGAASYFRKPFTLAEYLELPKMLLAVLGRFEGQGAISRT